MEYCCFIWSRASQYSLFLAFKIYSSFQADETSIIINYNIFYFHGQSSDELRSLVSPVQTFTARIWHAAYILFSFPVVFNWQGGSCDQITSYWDPLFLRTESRKDAFPITKMLTSLDLSFTVTYNRYPQNIHSFFRHSITLSLVLRGHFVISYFSDTTCHIILLLTI